MTVYNAGPILFESVSAVTTSPSVEVGTCRREGDEEYIYCYNTGSSTAGVSYGVTLSGVTGYSVTVSSVTSVDKLIGIVKHAAIPTGSYGWVMTKGFAAFEAEADNSFAAGQLITVAADGEFAMKSNSTGYPAPAFGKAMEAVASGASGMGYFFF